MEANFFRFAVDELYQEIAGLRIQKVHMPAPALWTFSFGGPVNLVFFHRPRGGFFFLSPQKLPNPDTAQARVMWLRKRIKSQHIVGCVNLWPWRRAAFELSKTGRFLILDICKGLSIESEIAAPDIPSWPGLDEISRNIDIWKTHPQITPPLREALSSFGRDRAGRFLEDLSRGKVRTFYVYKDRKDMKKAGCFLPDDQADHEVFEGALDAARSYGLPEVHAMVTDAPGRIRSAAGMVKRLHRNLEKTCRDKERMTRMVMGAEKGRLIKAWLHTLDPGSRLKELVLDDEKGNARVIALDPGMSVLENMERFFRKAAKGKRGLDFLRKREKELQEQLEKVEDPRFADSLSISVKNRSPGKGCKPQISGTQLRRFRSSDGFIILRAKNRQAGHKLLSREAAQHDLWFHVLDGPGAHVVLKRPHELAHVPERTLEEAANLAALASYRKNDLKADVCCARVRDVRKIKGLEQGRVHVDKVLRSIQVDIDQAMESRLETP
jgi:predicted ribosome quality control (RQC) complex YloA/Tae2 family protein